MFVRPAQLDFAKKITHALSGSDLDLQITISREAILFEQLQYQIDSLKSALGLIQDKKVGLSKTTQSPFSNVSVEEGYVFSGDFGASSDLNNDLTFLDSHGLHALSNYASTGYNVVSDPNQTLSLIFIDGCEQALMNWLVPVDAGGIQDASQQEIDLINTYMGRLSSLKSKVTAGTVTQQDRADLFALPNNFTTEVEALEVETQIIRNKAHVFWQTIMFTQQEMKAALIPTQDTLAENLSAQNLKIAETQRIISLLEQFDKTMKNFINIASVNLDIEYFDFGHSIMNGLIESYLEIGNILKMIVQNLPQNDDIPLSRETADIITNLFNTVDGIAIGETFFTGIRLNVTLDDLIGYLYVYEIISERNSIGGISEAAYKDDLNIGKQYWDERVMGSFDLTRAFDRFINNLFYRVDAPLSILFKDNNINIVNPLFLPAVLQLITASSASFITMNTYYAFSEPTHEAIASLNDLVTLWSIEALQIQQQMKNYEFYNLDIFPYIVEQQEAFVKTVPLQTAYKSIILDKFLPQQEYVMGLIGEQLTYSNKIATYINDILEIITAFHTSEVYYSLTIYLKQMNLIGLKGAVEKAVKARADEIVRAQTDINRTKLALTKIESIKTLIRQDPDMNDAQKLESLTLFEGYEHQFDSLLNYLSKLNIFLKQLELVAVAEPDNNYIAFEVTVSGIVSEEWLGQLAIYESFVVEGGYSSAVPGGENQIFKQLEADHQNYTTFNQNQQLALQLESSAIQQEWTMISTGLALLNQIFAKIIRRIKA